ncbi:MAG: flippase [candidate division KSB1 bacterium]|nr:flippase [candidate division KSB1 bacterium]
MTASTPKAPLLNPTLLARNVGYNLIGMTLPLMVALVALPLLVKGLGAERFGILALSWVVLGYFSVFDFGLGRVVINMIGERLGKGRNDEVPTIAWTGLFFLALLGGIMSVVLYLASPLLVHKVLKISAELQPEALQAFRVLSVSVIFIILTVGLRAVQEAHQKFIVLNLIRSANGVLTYLAPLLLLPFTKTLRHYIGILAVIRALIMAVNAVACALQFPDIRNRAQLDFQLAKPMFRLGGWMSISNLIGPVMVYFDRFLMGAWLSVAAVTFYVTPYEIISKLLVVTSAVVQVLFPAFSISLGADRARTTLLYNRALKILLLLFFPIALGVVLFARWALALWLSPEFAVRSTGVAQWLAIGIFLNAPGQIAYILLQAGGRPDITAKIHVIEVPFYLVLLYLGVKLFGITGAAVVWTFRLLIELFVFLYLADKIVLLQAKNSQRFIRTTVIASIMLIWLTFFQFSLWLAAALFLLGIILAISFSSSKQINLFKLVKGVVGGGI